MRIEKCPDSCWRGYIHLVPGPFHFQFFFVIYIEIANLKKRYVCRFPLFLMHISLNHVILNKLIIYLAYHANFEHREIDRNQ